MTIADSQIWKQLFEIPQTRVRERNAVLDNWVPSLSAEDIEEILKLMVTGSEEQQDQALYVMMNLIGRKHPKVLSVEDSVIHISRELALKHYPVSPRGIRAKHLLFLIGIDRFSDFLVKDVDFGRLKTSRDWNNYISDLSIANTPSAISRLNEIATLGNEASKEAIRLLELKGYATSQKIESVAAEWRKTHSYDSLQWLYDAHLQRIPLGSPIKPLLDLLGDPASQEGNHLCFQTTGGGSLYLEKDDHGRLVAHKFE